MIIDTDKIYKLLASDLTGYRVCQLVDISQQQYDKYRKGQAPISVMSLKTAEELTKIINSEEKSMYKLIIKEEGKLQTVEAFESFKDLKDHLLTNDYFSWINENDPDRELPDFSSVETVREINGILSDYDYDWWTVGVIENG